MYFLEIYLKIVLIQYNHHVPERLNYTQLTRMSTKIIFVAAGGIFVIWVEITFVIIFDFLLMVLWSDVDSAS